MDVDLRPGMELVARVEGFYDAAAEELVWRFRSLEPDTLLPTEDALKGFLPPNVEAPEGEGFVTFTVRPREGLASGSPLEGGRSRDTRASHRGLR